MRYFTSPTTGHLFTVSVLANGQSDMGTAAHSATCHCITGDTGI